MISAQMMANLSLYFATQIEMAEVQYGTGLEKYKSYFVSATMYESYRAAVDIKLTADGYSQCIYPQPTE